MKFSHRIQQVKPSMTLAIDAKAKDLIAQGDDVIGFGAGEPDFATPAHIVDAAVSACQNAVYHRYGPAAGLPALPGRASPRAPAARSDGPARFALEDFGSAPLRSATSRRSTAGDLGQPPAQSLHEATCEYTVFSAA